MIKLRTGAGAFLSNNGNVLLIKRSPNKKLAPGAWSCVGGHIEPHEMNDPYETCVREIEEETGISRSEIESLELLYIMIRMRSGGEISHWYIYFGETTRTEVIQTNEGTLHWVPESELQNLEYTQTFTAMLKHYAARSPEDRAVYVGVAGNDNGSMTMTWGRCEDFE